MPAPFLPPAPPGDASDAARLKQQIDFIIEIDRAKHIFRQNLLTDGSRRENDAEHSWHLALMALVLRDYAAPEVDICRVMQMILLHDIVEIDAGDTFVYDDAATASKTERELLAAERIFGLLPADQAQEWRALWDEFEARETPSARFAAALDRLHPMLCNYASGGGGWQAHHVPVERVLEKNALMAEGSEVLWEFAQNMIRDAQERGFLQFESEKT
jgi:putative hydrolase of HD superfamily